jgi:hypothetical protein
MSELPSEIVDLESVSAHPNILIFSKPKAGKTTWACSDDNTLLINCEVEGEISAANSETLGRDVKQWPVRKYEDFRKCTEWLKELVRQGKTIPFQWIVVDTLSTLQDRQMMRYVLDKMLVSKPNRNKFIPDKPEYLENQLMLVQDIKELCDLPVNVIFLAHVMQQTDPEGVDFYYPQIQGSKYKVAQQILSMVTSYGYMFVKDVKKDGKPTGRKDRYIMWEDSGHMQGGDRTGVFGQYTKNVTLKELRVRLEARALERKANASNQA